MMTFTLNKNVKTFHVLTPVTPPANYHFSQLENLYVDHRPLQLLPWRHFLKEHSHLKKFYMKCVSLNDEEFENFVADLMSLIELSLVLTEGSISAECVRNLLKSHHNLMHFRLISDKLWDMETLRGGLEGVGEDWNVEIIQSGYLFQRRIK